MAKGTQDGAPGAGTTGPGQDSGAAKPAAGQDGGAGAAPASKLKPLGAMVGGKPDAVLAKSLGLNLPPEALAGGEAGKDGGAAGAGKDGAPKVPEGYVPVARLNEVKAKSRETMLRAGIDPDTGAPIPGRSALADAAQREDAKAKDADADADAAWRKDLKPLPSKEGKPGKDGALVAWDDDAEYIAALAEARAHNAAVEATGRARDADERARLEREGAAFRAEERKAFETFAKETVPAFCKAEGIAAAAFAESTDALAAMENVPVENSRLFWGFALHQAAEPARFVYEFGKLPAPERERLAALPRADLLIELSVMNRLHGMGLALDGKARAMKDAGKAPLTDARGGGNGDGTRANPRLTAAPAPPASVTGSGGAREKSYAEMTAAERHAKQNADRLAERKRRLGQA